MTKKTNKPKEQLNQHNNTKLNQHNNTKLNQLGNPVIASATPNEAELEYVNNPHLDVDYVVRFTCPEFTSICPITSQPDFAHLFIDYVPDKFIVESKSLKLYLQSYRQFGAFHEDCTIKIAKKICAIIKPKWLRIAGYWFPRGGMPIDIFYQTGQVDKQLFIPSIEYKMFNGR